MKRIILFSLLVYSTSLFAVYTEKVKMPSISFPMTEDKNFRTMQRNCQWCHSYGYIINQGKQSRAFWNRVVVKMRETYKAPITARDEKAATDYLYKYFGNGKLN